MSGMDMMLKAMGIDPQAMIKQAEEVGKVVMQVAEALKRIEDRQIMIDEKLNLLLSKDTDK